MTDAPEIEAVRQKASKSSFYSAMKMMAKPQREGMYAIYAFCRVVDDIADDGIGTRIERTTALQEWRDDLGALYVGGRGGRAAFLRGVVDDFGPRLQDFIAVIDGMQMDVDEDIVAPSLEVLDLYCDRVASAVGRLSIKVFGMEEEPGFALAHHLGRALQLTNILRDLDEDAEIGRLYLPRDYLGIGIAPVTPKEALELPSLNEACRKVAALAETHYEAAHQIMAKKPQGDIRAPRLMGAVYHEILKRMMKIGWKAPRKRVKLPKPVLAYLALRYGLGG
ncbi:phytoene synthase [Rhizomicrobium palustre]|uniref:Phytoene synthase n=1 Tax=Rhizomicrobium palustre TaxID=189966 RepID=A0A846MYU1_9PROT|nr:presqualene diphosphate synthase HpnD [Rhizomicrobium palustre]NIK88798.1 phytoene synthase [Rhizomicrobium palustre]